MAPSPQQQKVAHHSKIHEGFHNTHGAAKEATAQISAATVLVGGGSFLLLLVSLIPIWNAVVLLQDFNYAFWVGYDIPRAIIIVHMGIVFLYAIVSKSYIGDGKRQGTTEENIMNLVIVSMSISGLCLMMFAQPLIHQANVISQDLLYHCQTSETTHRVYEYEQVLQNIRATPACAVKFSVEECNGYQESYPFTQYMKTMEQSFRCSGFCSKKTVAPYNSVITTLITQHNQTETSSSTKSSSSATSSAHSNSTHSSANSSHSNDTVARERLARDEEGWMPNKTSLLGHGESIEADEKEGAQMGASWTYPPTLFSDANHRVSCEGMAARSMKNIVLDIGLQCFYQGLYLVCISVTTGFLKLLGFCFRKNKD